MLFFKRIQKIFRITLLLAAVLLAANVVCAQELTFLKVDSNHIAMNGADWSHLRKALAEAKHNKTSVVSMVQIGDSHMQPDVLSMQVRRMLQSEWGNAGRGLVAPMSLAHTNQPLDFVFTADAPVRASARLMGRRPWSVDVGLAGVAVKLDSAYCNIGIKVDDYDFSHVMLLHAKGNGYKSARIDDDVLFAREVSEWASAFDLKNATSQVTMGMNVTDALFGAVLSNGKGGVLYNSIGNNGATYGSYMWIDGFGEQLALLHPQLVVLSLGTNEAFGSTADVYENIDALVRLVRKTCPNAQILLTTPMECQKKSSHAVKKRVKVRRRKYKTVTTYVSTSTPNTKIKTVRDAIVRYGKRNKIAVWDMYTVAGGAGSSRHWISNELLKSDHIHCSVSGYELQGQLLGDALLEKLK